MQWFGKVIGAALGMAVAGPWGAALGALLGHQFDQGVGGPDIRAGHRAQQAFFTATFEVMGHVAKVDGRVSEEEVQIARRIMHAMNLAPNQVRIAIDRFTDGKRPDYPLKQRLADLADQIGHRRELARAFVEIQVQAVVGSGEMGQEKRGLLWTIARSLGLSRVELAHIEAMLRARQRGTVAQSPRLDLRGAYTTLGVESDATDKEVKTAYRRLMNQHHPDKLVSKGLPESMISLAEERTQEIRAAYERIKSDRQFK